MSSFSSLPFVTLERRGGLTSTPATGRTSLRVSQLRSVVDATKKIPAVLLPLALSLWQKILASQNDQAYIAMMGSNCKSFDRIFEEFGPMFLSHTSFDASEMIFRFEYVCGHWRTVQPVDCLGLVLVWMQTRGALNVLQLVFGLTYSNLSVYL